MGVFPLVGELVVNRQMIAVGRAPDADHGVDALLDIAQGVDHLAGALAGQILERAGGEDRHHLVVHGRAELGIRPALAEAAGQRHQLLGRVEDFERGALGRNHDGVKLAGRRDDLVVVGVGRLQRGDLVPRPLDRGRHLDQFLAQDVDAVGRFDRLTLLTPGEPELLQHRADFLRRGAQGLTTEAPQKGASLRRPRYLLFDILELVLGQLGEPVHNLYAPSTD